jgi:hypothetical protein
MSAAHIPASPIWRKWSNVVAVALLLFTCYQLGLGHGRHEQQMNQYAAAKAQYDQMQTQYADLKKQYGALQQCQESLQKQYADLHLQYDRIEGRKASRSQR